jgi:ABC-type lipoprotein release transport system permease subunit
MSTITILAMLAIFAGATLSITGSSVISSVDAQMTDDNATMSGNMTGGNATGGNMTEPSGSISGMYK